MTDKPFDVVTWGETMVRLSPPVGIALEEARQLDVIIGGTESNMAVALARCGKRVGWSSRLPDNPLGRRVAREMGSQGVDVSHVVWAPRHEKMGVFFIELGAVPRPNTVLYDRKGTALARLRPEELDYAYLASGRILHLTGITPALGEGCREAWLHSARAAKDAGSMVTLDVNYRGLLWSHEQCRETMEQVLPQVDGVFCGIRDMEAIFGVPAEPEVAARTFADAYGVSLVVLTLGAEGALAWHDGEVARHPAFPTDVVDRIGAGDAFDAGFLYGWLERDIAWGLRCGNALAALKQTYRGDATWSTLADLQELVESETVDPRRVAR